MRMRGWCLLGLAALWWAGGAAARSGEWISSDDYAALNVVVADSASDTEKMAAHEFADLWRKATGRGVFVSNTPYLKTGVIVWIGQEGVPPELIKYVKPGDLGTDGYCIRTLYLKKARQGHLAILGGKERGTMYGVYAFFEDCFGVRFLTPDCTYVPTKPPTSLPNINARYTPPILRRQSAYDTYGMQAYPDDQRVSFQHHMRWSASPEFGLAAHSVFAILPPDKYFAEHPEFFSEIDGKRVAPVGIDLNNPVNAAQHGELRSQLCFSNPKVAEAITAELNALMKASPAKTVWSVSQMDWDAHCQCAACKAIDDAEGSPMGSILTCVNRVADAIKAEFPGNVIETLAYNWSRKPPKNIKPRDNVIVTVCGNDANYAQPLSDKKSSAPQAFAADLMAWKKVAKNVHVWDYPANGHYAPIPYPDFDVLGANFAFYAQQGVTGVTLRGGGLLADDLGALRSYVLSRLMWQPETDVKSAMDEFTELYYEEAAPFIREYIALMTGAVHAKGGFLSCCDAGAWIDAGIIARAEDIFKRALEADVSETVKQRIEDAHCSIRYAAIVCPPKISTTAETIVLDRPACMTVEEYIAHVTARGAKSFDANRPLPDYIMERTGKAAAPRHEESPLEKLENDRCVVWVAPALKGSIVRWAIKARNVELLRGYEAMGTAPGTIQEWRNLPGPSDGPAVESYETAERAPERLVLRGTSADGLQVERVMELEPGKESLAITLTLTNPTDKPLAANAKIHPEFSMPSVPEIWLHRGAAWEQLNKEWDGRAVAAHRFVPADDVSCLACWAPACQLGIECAVDAKEIGGVFWLFDVSAGSRQCNLEVVPKSEPINAGEKRIIHARYSASTKRPSD